MNNNGWLPIAILNLISYFIFRFGMISRGALRTYIEFLGGMLLTASFILMFVLHGLKDVLILVVFFWFLTTPITEICINRIDEQINKPYQEIHKHLAKKYGTTPEEVKKRIYDNLDKS